jgi:hypothetical protein
VVRTTPEHPFWVKGKGWTAAGALQAGDELSSHDGRWVAVEEVYDTGEFETVYNVRVAEHHTYFVGRQDWGFSVWAHNAYKEYVEAMEAAGAKAKPNAIRKRHADINKLPEAEQRAAFEKYIAKQLGKGISDPQVQRIADIAMAPNSGNKGGVQANLDGKSGEQITTNYYGVPKNTEQFVVNGRTRIPDHIIERDPVTQQPLVVADSKNARRIDRLSTQFQDDLDLVGPNGRLRLAVPTNAYVASTVINSSRIILDRILPPK